jgi:hypothetical protein
LSLVDTKETITTVKAAAYLHIMSQLKEGSIYKHIKMKQEFSSSCLARPQHACQMNQYEKSTAASCT